MACNFIVSRYNQDVSWIGEYSPSCVLFDRSEQPYAGSIMVPNLGTDIADKASVKPGAEFMQAVIDWLDKGSDAPQDRPGDGALIAAVARPIAAVAGPKPEPTTDDLAARMAAKKAANSILGAPTSSTANCMVSGEPKPMP